LNFKGTGCCRSFDIAAEFQLAANCSLLKRKIN
jgi:hypothetical protein